MENNKDIFWHELEKEKKLGDHTVIVLDETVSTNSDAMDLGRKGQQTGTVVIARSQTGGRGRLGKNWLSPTDRGLYFSVILRPLLEPADLPKITLAAGLSLCRAITSVCSVSPMIKWPNDLLLDGRKCGGILTESHLENAKRPLVVLGIGLNISTPSSFFPSDLQQKATSLQQHCKTVVNVKKVLLSILREADEMIKSMERGKFPEILDQWKKYDATKGKKLTWLTTGRKPVSGISLGPDEDGRLHIKDDQGQVFEVLSGDIQLQL